MNYRISISEIRLNNGGYEYGKYGRYYGNVRGSRLYQIDFVPLIRGADWLSLPIDKREVIVNEIEQAERELGRKQICDRDGVSRSASRDSLKQQILSVLPDARFFR